MMALQAHEPDPHEILVVDDVPTNLRVLERILASAGYRVREAASGAEALRSVAAAPPDLVLLDVGLPDLDGFEICRRLKADPVHHRLPVLFISVSGGTGDKVRGFEAGGLDYLTKPFQAAEVLARVRTHLRLHDLNERLEHLVETRTEKLVEASRLLQDEAAERAKLQVQLAQSQKMECLGSLAGGVAHDMNNVLGAILALASAHLSLHPEDGQSHDAFATISRAAVRGGEMAKRLLSFARKRPAMEQEVDLNQVLREQIGLLERTTLARVRLDLELAGDLRPILGDPGALSHAFMNLCVNAVDAMGDGGTLALRSWNLEGGQVAVQVADDGCGMPPEVLERALDPFFTTKPEGKGTGLGLPMVYSTVKAHGGRLDLDSEPGAGTRILATFPAMAPSAGVRREEPGLAGGARRTGLKVLLVDDDELIQTSMVMLLELMGHAPRGVLTGEAALAELQGAYQPDLVILDLNMPGLGGEATLPLLRGLRPEVPVLIITGRPDHAAVALKEAWPRVALLAKPFTREDLEAFIDLRGPGGA